MHSYCLLFLAAALLPAGASAEPTQVEAMALAQVVNKNGSDQSLQNSTTNAMRALMELSNGNRSSALQNGYRAYGNYQTSEGLDGVRIRNAISALKMDSMGAALKNAGPAAVFLAPMSEYKTDFRRLDPAFLRKKGTEAAQVAEQFEKASGMSREAFLKHMTAASESGIKATDPNLIDKVLSKMEGFVKDIPNDDFRKRVEAQIASVPPSVRTGILAQAVQKGAQFLAAVSSQGPSKADLAAAQAGLAQATTSLGSEATKAAPAAASTAVTGVAPAKKGDDRVLASFAGPQLAVGTSDFGGLDREKFGGDAVGNVLQSAVDAQKDDDSIFKQVSRKYRSLTGSLQARPM